jgi:hypothetical protein
MPLVSLNLTGCRSITDLTPLANLKLTSIRLPPQQVMGMDALRKIASLTTINGASAEEFWQKRDNPKK